MQADNTSKRMSVLNLAASFQQGVPPTLAAEPVQPMAVRRFAPTVPTNDQLPPPPQHWQQQQQQPGEQQQPPKVIPRPRAQEVPPTATAQQPQPSNPEPPLPPKPLVPRKPAPPPPSAAPTSATAGAPVPAPRVRDAAKAATQVPLPEKARADNAMVPMRAAGISEAAAQVLAEQATARPTAAAPTTNHAPAAVAQAGRAVEPAAPPKTADAEAPAAASSSTRRTGTPVSSGHSATSASGVPVLYADFVLGQADQQVHLEATPAFYEAFRSTSDENESNVVAALGATHAGKSQLLKDLLKLHGHDDDVLAVAKSRKIAEGYSGTTGGITAVRFETAGRPRLCVLDCEGENASTAPSTTHAANIAWSQAHIKRRNELVQQFLPRVMYSVADVIIFMTTDDPADHSSLDTAIAFAARSTDNVESFLPHLIVLFNKRDDEDIVGTVQEQSDNILGTHQEQRDCLANSFQSVTALVVPSFKINAELYKERVQVLDDLIFELVASSRTRRSAVGCLLGEKMWMRVFQAIVSSDSSSPIHISQFLDNVMYPLDEAGDTTKRAAYVFRHFFDASFTHNKDVFFEMMRYFGYLLLLEKDRKRQSLFEGLIDADARKQRWTEFVVAQATELIRDILPYEICAATHGKSTTCCKSQRLHPVDKHVPAQVVHENVAAPETQQQSWMGRLWKKFVTGIAVIAKFVFRPAPWPGSHESAFNDITLLINACSAVTRADADFVSSNTDQARDRQHAIAAVHRLHALNAMLLQNPNYQPGDKWTNVCYLCVGLYDDFRACHMQQLSCGHFLCKTCYKYTFLAETIVHSGDLMDQPFLLPSYCMLCAASDRQRAQ